MARSYFHTLEECPVYVVSVETEDGKKKERKKEVEVGSGREGLNHSEPLSREERGREGRKVTFFTKERHLLLPM